MVYDRLRGMHVPRTCQLNCWVPCNAYLYHLCRPQRGKSPHLYWRPGVLLPPALVQYCIESSLSCIWPRPHRGSTPESDALDCGVWDGGAPREIATSQQHAYCQHSPGRGPHPTAAWNLDPVGRVTASLRHAKALLLVPAALALLPLPVHAHLEVGAGPTRHFIRVLPSGTLEPPACAGAWLCSSACTGRQQQQLTGLAQLPINRLPPCGCRSGHMF